MYLVLDNLQWTNISELWDLLATGEYIGIDYSNCIDNRELLELTLAPEITEIVIQNQQKVFSTLQYKSGLIVAYITGTSLESLAPLMRFLLNNSNTLEELTIQVTCSIVASYEEYENLVVMINSLSCNFHFVLGSVLSDEDAECLATLYNGSYGWSEYYNSKILVFKSEL